MTGRNPRGAVRRRRVRWSVLAAALTCLAGALTGCSNPSTDPSAHYFPAGAATDAIATGIAAETNAAAYVGSGSGALPAKGPVSRPDPTLTPGAVATSDTNTVCQAPKHVRQAVPYALQQATFTRYRLTAVQARHYVVDYLIPLELGGSTGLSNLWPAAIRGNGFHEKQQLNQRLRTLVCRGSLSLTSAQTGVAADWFAMWLAHAGS